MPFHTGREVSTFVYQYTARTPIENLELVDEQILLAHRYQNKLIEIERERRQRYRDLLGTDREVAAARAAEAAAKEAYQQAAQDDADERKVSRRRQTSDSTKALLKVLKTRSRETRAIERTAAKERFQDELKASDEEAWAAAKEARGACGVYWGTYLIVERSIPRSGPEPHFQRWDGEGQVAVQIQKGMTEETLTSCEDNRARLELRDDWGATRRASKHGTLWLRIGSEGRAPIWTKVPINFSRRLPPGCMVKWIQLIRRRRGTHLHWFVSMTIERPGAAMKATPLAKPTTLSKAVALDLGWRRKADGSVRVAYAYDGTNSFEIALPVWVIEGYGIVRDLRSIRDTNFNEARDRLVRHLAEHDVPEDTRDALAFLPQWRATARLAKVVRRWESAPDWLEAWRRQDRHLYEWERNQERRLLNWRKNWYRHWALWLAQTYDHVLMEDANIADIKRRPLIGEDKVEAVGAHVPASPGELRQQIRETAARECTPVHLVPSAHTTTTCSACGAQGLTRTGPLRVQCDACGVTHDQDCNAARVIYSFASGGTLCATPGPLAVPDAPWYRELMAVPLRVETRRQRLEGLARDNAVEGA